MSEDIDIEKERRNTKIGFGCISLFLAPFLITGTGALILGIRDIANGSDLTEDVIAKLGVGSMFTLIAGSFFALMVVGYRKSVDGTRLKGAFPGEPWKWQRDWLEGRVHSSSIGAMLVTGLFGVTFGAAGVLVIVKIGEIVEESPMGYIALLFPLVGFGMLASSIYFALQWLKYRKVHCDLVTNPGVIGGWFQAIIWAGINFGPNDKVSGQLTCYYRRQGKGKNDNTTRTVKWQEDFAIEQDRMMVERDGTYAIPIKIWIPRDCTPSTAGSPPDRYEWELSAKADVSGIDFSASFIVPMFETEESRDEPPANVAELSVGMEPQPFHPTILVTESAGSLKFHAPPRRNAGMMFSLTFFWLIWTAICVGMFVAGDIPILFPIVFSFFDLFLTYGVVWSWFGAATLTFDHDTVSIDRTIMGFGRRHFLNAKDITKVDMHSNMQSGNKPYYVIRLHHGATNTHTVGGIGNKDEAEQLIAQMEEYLANLA